MASAVFGADKSLTSAHSACSKIRSLVTSMPLRHVVCPNEEAAEVAVIVGSELVPGAMHEGTLQGIEELGHADVFRLLSDDLMDCQLRSQ